MLFEARTQRRDALGVALDADLDPVIPSMGFGRDPAVPSRQGGNRSRGRLIGRAVFGGLGLSLFGCLRRRQALSARIRVLDALSREDDLTGLYNRRYIEERLAGALSGARRHHHALSILFIDVDGFKRVNDELGHQVGDDVLRMVAQRIRLRLRSEDVVGRWGGEEFLAVLPMTPLSGALAVAERLRSEIAQTPVKAGGHTVAATVSIGCAEDHGNDVDSLLQEVDVALFRAKQGGRNRVCTLEQPTY
jgi:diguanylate cyclase (GGDEF)-like protein